MIDILDRVVELVFVPLRVAAILAAAVGQHPQQLDLLAVDAHFSSSPWASFSVLFPEHQPPGRSWLSKLCAISSWFPSRGTATPTHASGRATSPFLKQTDHGVLDEITCNGADHTFFKVLNRALRLRMVARPG